MVAVDILRGADGGTNRDYKSQACGYRTYSLCYALSLFPGSNVFSKSRLRIRTTVFVTSLFVQVLKPVLDMVSVLGLMLALTEMTKTVNSLLSLQLVYLELRDAVKNVLADFFR